MSRLCEIEGSAGLWHHVTTRDYGDMLAMLGKADGPLTVAHAKDFLEAGDGEFSAVNPRTMLTERYVTVFGPDNTVSLYRQVSP